MAIIKWSAINQIEWPYGALCVQRDEWPYRARCVLRDEWPYGARWNMEAIMHGFSKPEIRLFVRRSKCLVNNLSTLWKKSECLMKIRMPCEKSKCLVKKSECLKNPNASENLNTLWKNSSVLWKNLNILWESECFMKIRVLWRIRMPYENPNGLEKIRVS